MNRKAVYKSEDGKAAILKKYDLLLTKWPVPYKELYVGTRYGKTYIITSGDNLLPPLILLHGSGSNSSMWFGDIAEYAKYYKVFAVDIPGDPGKSEELQYSLKSAAYSEWMNDILTLLQLQKATFIGISLGAWMVINFALKHKAKVEKVVLISPSGIGAQKISFLLKSIVFSFLGDKGVDKIIREVTGNQPISEELVNYIKLINSNFNYRTEPIPIFTDNEISDLNIPLMMIVGEKDAMLHSEKSIARLSRLLPTANINLLPDYGHVLFNLTSRILPFLLSQ